MSKYSANKHKVTFNLMQTSPDITENILHNTYFSDYRLRPTIQTYLPVKFHDSTCIPSSLLLWKLNGPVCTVQTM